MAIEMLEKQVEVQRPGDTESTQNISHLIELHKKVMVERSPEQVEQFAGKAVIVKVKDSEGQWRDAAYAAFTHEYEHEGRLFAELGAVVSDPFFNGYRRELAALAIVKLMDMDITNKYDEVFALVKATNEGSVKLFNTLPIAKRIDTRLLPQDAFREEINGEADGPDNYVGFQLRRSTRQVMLNSAQS